MPTDIIKENFRWPFFVVPLLTLSLFFGYSVSISLIVSLLIYCAVGGWRFVRVVALTLPRDLKGLKALLSVKIAIWNMRRKGHTIPDLFEQTVDRYRSKVAFVFEDETWTFQAVDEYANKVAHHLTRLRVRPGDIVGLFMESRPAYVAIWVGISKIGAVPALINTNLRNEALIHCVRDAGVCGVICGSELSGTLAEVWTKVDGGVCFRLVLEARLGCRPANGLPPDRSLQGSDPLLLAESPQRPPSSRHTTRKVSDPLMYIYTSGTTGLPKAAKVSHARYLMMSYGAGQMLSIVASDVIYNPLPLYHTAGGMIGVGQVIVCGATMAIRKKFSASAFWTDCVKYEATVAQYIGEICRYLLAQPQRPEERQHKVRLAFGNGIRPQIWTEFQTRFKVARIGEFYGATESNANIVNSVNKVGSVGFGTRILPCLYPISLIKIDPVTNEPLRDKTGLCIQCQPDEVGELVGKIHDGDPIRRFDGYVNSSATGKKITHDVFKHGDRAFLTGDLLVQDELGFFYFKDRLGDTFRWKGENVSTAEVEAVVSNCLHLSDCVVYGVEIPFNEGRAGMAAIGDPERKVEGLADLSQKLQAALPGYARPLFIRVCQNIEMTGTFKMKKIDLVKEAFNPEVVRDALFYFDSKSSDYLPLTSKVYEQIERNLIRF